VVEQDLTISFIDWLIIKYNSRSENKIDLNNPEIVELVASRLKALGINYDEKNVRGHIRQRRERIIKDIVKKYKDKKGGIWHSMPEGDKRKDA
jgi:hypothetical protein